MGWGWELDNLYKTQVISTPSDMHAYSVVDTEEIGVKLARKVL